ncbi:MAG TPA: hypothetical protein VJN69_00150 [Candidatus Acidoferrales bacterium]|nr:hypothetical protein [Candidatus Acidoferrales bacterium]
MRFTFRRGVAKNKNREPPSLQILLIFEVLVGGHEDVESGFLSGPEQFTV